MSQNGKVNILLVDDQPAKLLTYEAILSDLGENLIKANSGREALLHLLKTDIAVVLMDVSMPELDGFELAEIIHQHPRYQKTAIIFVSAVHLTDLDRLKGYERGAVDYVSVPIIPEILRAKVSVFAELYRKTQQLEQLNYELEQRIAARTAELEASTARLAESEERYRRLVHPLPAAIYTCDAQGRVTLFNEAAVALWGREPEIGKDMWGGYWRIYKPDGTALPLEEGPMAVTIREGRPIRGQEIIIERPDGSRSHVLPYPDPIRNSSEEVIGAVNMLVDLTEHKQAEAQLRQQTHILETLNKAGEALIASTDYKTTLSNLTHVIVPNLADWCVVDVIGEDGLIHRLAVVHRDPAKAELAAQLQNCYPALDPQGGHTIAKMLRQGRSWFDAEVAETRLAAEARDAEHLRLLRGLGFASEMVVPLMARGHTLGTLTFVRASAERHYEPADLSLAEELARRAALAIDNARLYSTLRESEERFRVAIQNSPIVVYNTDQELRCTWIANPHPNFPLERMTGSHDDKTSGSEQAAPLINLKNRVLKSGTGARQEISLPTSLGEQTWDVTVEPLRAENGEIMGLTVAALDISERKRAEERMAQLQAVAAALSAALTPSQVYEVIVREAASALDAKAGALYIVSDDGQWLDLVQITGYGEGASEADLRFPLTAPLPAAEAARTGEAIWLESTQTGDAARSQWPDKAETTGCEAAASLPLWFEGQALGSLNFSFATARALDPENREFLLTLARVCAQALERARLYQKAQQLNTELEQRVAERTAELERSLQDLNHFTYVASHDLKAPLRAVDYLANWIVADAGDVLPEASKIHLAKLQGRIKRMERLLDDLLTYSRVDRHYYQSMESVDTGVLIKEIIDLLTPPLGFTIAVQEKMPRLMAHRVLLELIFKNLIENAIKHHHRADGRVDISAREVDGFVEFCVADDGPGIDDIFHERIFQIFQTLQPRDKVEGTGVGLAIVKRAVESQGGAISVISARGQGTTFRFTWPKGQTVLETA